MWVIWPAGGHQAEREGGRLKVQGEAEVTPQRSAQVSMQLDSSEH